MTGTTYKLSKLRVDLNQDNDYMLEGEIEKLARKIANENSYILYKEIYSMLEYMITENKDFYSGTTEPLDTDLTLSPDKKTLEFWISD